MSGSSVGPARVQLHGQVWTGGDADVFAGTVFLDADGRILQIARRDVPADGTPEAAHRAADEPAEPGRGPIDVIGTAQSWIGPGVVDAHVHQAFADRPDELAPGLVGVRDLGAPLASAQRWSGNPALTVSGPILTGPGGYPSRSWGRDGFARGIDSPADAVAVVTELATAGMQVIKVALEPGPGWAVPTPDVLRAVVDCAHDHDLAVVAHALRRDMVHRALDASIDELAHTPTERLDDEDVDRIADAGVSVVSTLQTFFAAGDARAAAANAQDLVAAGVVLRYGTDLGNTGTTTGVDPRELDRLADAGLGREGALLAATLHSARAPGIRGRTGLLRLGDAANLVVLSADPVREPAAWRNPLVTFVDGRRSPVLIAH